MYRGRRWRAPSSIVELEVVYDGIYPEIILGYKLCFRAVPAELDLVSGRGVYQILGPAVVHLEMKQAMDMGLRLSD
jgi:hypothetical protein